MRALSLLVNLRRCGLALAPEGSRLRVAPRSALTSELRETLTTHKDDLLAALSVENHLLQMRLDEFERDGCAIELKVPGLKRSIWFVPGEAHIEALVQRNITRGRIWTAKELRALWGGGSEARESAIPLARIKLALDGEVVSVEDQHDPKRQEGRSK
jgi:hypothetical protein